MGMEEVMYMLTLFGGTKDNHKKDKMRIICIPAKIHTTNLQNTRQKHYCLSQLA